MTMTDISPFPLRVTIVGTGYVGLTTALALSYVGHDVIGVDKDPIKIQQLRDGISPIHESHADHLLNDVKGKLKFTTNLEEYVKDSAIIIIAVGTPPKANGEADTQYVESAAHEIANSILEGQKLIIVIKSTVPIGSNHRVSSIIERNLNKRGVAADVSFVSNPEFLREGMALHDTFYPDRIVIGSHEDRATRIMTRMYRPLIEQTFIPPSYLPRPKNLTLPDLVTTDSTSAEMIKYAANAFLATKISFINEIAGLCEKVGAHISEVSHGIGLDTRIGTRFLNAGLGWGGSCFPKDTQALQAIAEEYGYDLPIIQAARDVNNRQRSIVIEKLQRVLHVLRGRTVTVLGLAFKPGTDDIRESPSIDIIHILIQRGAHVRVHDPVAFPKAKRLLDNLDIEWHEDAITATEGSDAIVLATEWEEYLNLDWHSVSIIMNRKIVIDGRNMLDQRKLESLGFIYSGIGIPESSQMIRSGAAK